jgi:hypothetical protein
MRIGFGCSMLLVDYVSSGSAGAVSQGEEGFDNNFHAISSAT